MRRPGFRRRRRRRRRRLGACKRSDRAGLGNDWPELGESSAFGWGSRFCRPDPGRPGPSAAAVAGTGDSRPPVKPPGAGSRRGDSRLPVEPPGPGQGRLGCGRTAVTRMDRRVRWL